ncbi:CotZ-related putative spore coat protein [Bacillus safensis]|uniref:CotZ-related putative spore coat protein n=1 Tax=Bacillus safensis TaxID=561879 RepID=UPI0024E05A3F|nr:CotZ-related putative spore coat protein [Bacillus safensis]
MWRNGRKLLNTATVVLHDHDDQNVPVSISIQRKKTCHEICVQKGESRAITVKDMILILKKQSAENVQARLEIQLNMVQRKKIRL